MKKSDNLLNLFLTVMLCFLLYSLFNVECFSNKKPALPEESIPIRCMDDGFLYHVVDGLFVPIYQNDLKTQKKCKKI